MYHLITFPAGMGTLSFSPFCIKAAWLLNHAGVAWERQDENDPRKYAHGKLPVLRDGEQLIHDSDGIRLFLEQQGADFWGDTSPRDKAIGHAFIRMAEEHIYFFGAIDRWMNDAVWPHTRDAYFHQIPNPIRRFVTNGLRKNLRRGLHTQGLMRLSPAEQVAKREADLAAVTAMLDGRDFLLGDAPTLPDFSVAAMLQAMSVTSIETDQTRRVQNDPVLMGYIARMEAACA